MLDWERSGTISPKKNHFFRTRSPSNVCAGSLEKPLDRDGRRHGRTMHLKPATATVTVTRRATIAARLQPLRLRRTGAFLGSSVMSSGRRGAGLFDTDGSNMPDLWAKKARAHWTGRPAPPPAACQEAPLQVQ